MRTSRNRLLRTGAAVSIALSLAVGTSTPATSAPRLTPAPITPEHLTSLKVAPKGDKIGSADLSLLAQAELDAEPRVTVMIATERKQTAAVVRSLEAGGAYIATANDDLGYIRASVLTGAVERVAGLARVTALDLDRTVPLDPRTAEPASVEGASASTAPNRTTPDANPYMPTQDTGSVDFKKKNPSYDGRGVTIGIVDSGVDLDHPALQTTTTGAPKIIDWVSGTDPVIDGDLSWRPMTTQVTAVPTFAYQSMTWVAPRAGDFRVNTFREDITSTSEPAGDINRDGDTTDAFGILYDPSTNDIWVDANQDQAFTTSEMMRPFAEKRHVGHFGTDNPTTPIAERTPFVVEYREDVNTAALGQPGTADFVSIGLVQNSHGTHVAGIAAASGMFGGTTMNGQAPGAQIVSSRACTWSGGCTEAALLDGMVDLVVNRDVDVVNMSIGGVAPLNDGNNARAVVYDRLIDDYGVQMFISAGNSGAGQNSIADPSLVNKVVSVGSSITRETWKANYGSVVPSAQALHPFTSRGPTEAGDFKPNIVAPGSAVSTVPQWLALPGVAEAGYTLPIGYAMFNGTSMSSPQATGSAALLLSAGVQRGLSITPKQLRDAIYTAATPIPGEPVTGQGTGLLNVPAAWKLLQRPTTSDEYTTEAPVCSALSGELKVPNRGPGLYNRCSPSAGGQQLGVAKSYDLTVTRTSGLDRATRHTVRIIGNDGTFKAPNSVSLAAGKPATVTVTATAKTIGVHAAYLEIDDPKTPVIDHRVNLTVDVGHEITGPAFSQQVQGSVERNRTVSYLFDVPAGTKSLVLDMSGIATRSQTRFTTYSPYGQPMDGGATTVCYTNFGGGNGCDPLTRSFTEPVPGLWEVVVEARRTSPVLENPFTISASLYDVSIDPNVQSVPASADGSPTTITWTATNSMAPVSVVPVSGDLGSNFVQSRTISQGERQTYDVEIPSGASQFIASIQSPSDPLADLDLQVLNSDGQPVGQALGGGPLEFVALTEPPAGTYTVVVNGFSVPSGSTTFGYSEQITAPGLGQVEFSSTPIRLEPGKPVTFTGVVRSNAALSSGRSLAGIIALSTERGGQLVLANIEITPSPQR